MIRDEEGFPLPEHASEEQYASESWTPEVEEDAESGQWSSLLNSISYYICLNCLLLSSCQLQQSFIFILYNQ